MTSVSCDGLLVFVVLPDTLTCTRDWPRSGEGGVSQQCMHTGSSSDGTGGTGVPCDGVLGRIVGDLWALPNDTVTVHKSDSY
jgi:hypothetical protein